MWCNGWWMWCNGWWSTYNFFKIVRPNCVCEEPCLSICDAWCLLFLTSLICISCHMHHGLFITLMHLCIQFESEKSSKCAIGILRPSWKSKHTFRGSFIFKLLDTHIFYKKQIVVVINQQKGGDWKCILAPNCFGDSDKHNLWYFILDQDVCRS
jgi:hypothetical protein